MKKIITLLITATLMTSSLTMSVCGAVSKSTPKTFIATNREYNSSTGCVYNQSYIPKSLNKKSVNFDNTSSVEYNYNDLYHYMRGNTIYYSGYSLESSSVRSYNVKTKKYKTLYKKDFDTPAKLTPIKLIGGYGADVIFQYGKNVYICKNGSVKKLFARTDKNAKYDNLQSKCYDTKIFNGKLFYQNKMYDIATKKVKSFGANKLFATDKYLYFINKNNNLKRMTLKGSRELISKNVSDICFANNSGTVVFEKNSTLYKKTNLGTAIKFASLEQMKKIMEEKSGVTFDNIAARTVICADKKVYCLTYADNKSTGNDAMGVFSAKTSGKDFSFEEDSLSSPSSDKTTILTFINKEIKYSVVSAPDFD